MMMREGDKRGRRHRNQTNRCRTFLASTAFSSSRKARVLLSATSSWPFTSCTVFRALEATRSACNRQ